MSNYLRELRNNMTLEEVAKAVNRSKAYICDLELGRRVGSVKTLQALAHLYNCDFEELCAAQSTRKEEAAQGSSVLPSK